MDRKIVELLISLLPLLLPVIWIAVSISTSPTGGEPLENAIAHLNRVKLTAVPVFLVVLCCIIYFIHQVIVNKHLSISAKILWLIFLGSVAPLSTPVWYFYAHESRIS